LHSIGNHTVNLTGRPAISDMEQVARKVPCSGIILEAYSFRPPAPRKEEAVRFWCPIRYKIDLYRKSMTSAQLEVKCQASTSLRLILGCAVSRYLVTPRSPWTLIENLTLPFSALNDLNHGHESSRCPVRPTFQKDRSSAVTLPLNDVCSGVRPSKHNCLTPILTIELVHRPQTVSREHCCGHY
jgi:hypothetical protein